MAYGKGEKKEIESKELLRVSKTDNENRGTTVIVRVVDWISGGKHYPQLEKREFYTDQETGELKMGKAKGFTRKDLEKVQDTWGEIMQALGGHLPEQKARPGGSPAAVATAPAPAKAPAAAVIEEDLDF